MLIKPGNINFPESTAKTAIAVSGGVDSMCLSYLATLHYREALANVIVLIVDHGLRAESSHEANNTREFLIKQGFQVEILNWQEGEKPVANIHQKARDARYRLMLDYCKQHNINFLLTAHNLNDQAETVLLRIYRGSGIDGISAIPHEVVRDGITILRPLLQVPRAQIEATIKQCKWPYIIDSSNFNTRFERTKIRNLFALLDEPDLWLSRLGTLAENATRVRRFLETETHKALFETVWFSELGYASLDYQALLMLDDEIKYRVLVRILNRVSGHTYPPRFKSLKKLLQAIAKDDKSLTTLWGCEIKKKKNRLIFFREQAAIDHNTKASDSLIWDNRFEIKYPDAFVAPFSQTAWQIVRGQIKTELPFKKIFYTIPAIYDNNGILIATPFFNNKSYFRFL